MSYTVSSLTGLLLACRSGHELAIAPYAVYSRTIDLTEALYTIVQFKEDFLSQRVRCREGRRGNQHSS